MLKILTDGQKIRAAQELFHSMIRKLATRSSEEKIGYKGGGALLETFYFEEDNLWVAINEEADKFWNAIGFGEKPSQNSITVEINPPKKDINRRIGGSFAEENDELFLVHRGKIGGGRRGIGKNTFLKMFSGKRRECVDGNQTTEVCLVASMDPDVIIRQIGEFARLVAEFKAQAVIGKTVEEKSAVTESGDLFQHIGKVLGYQSDYDASNTPEMQARLRHLNSAKVMLNDVLSGLTTPAQSQQFSLSVACSDGTGRKARVPWIRVYNQQVSPKATQGPYLVLLFRADGSGVYLSMNHGTQIWTGNEFKPQPREDIVEITRKARHYLNERGIIPDENQDKMDLRGPARSLSKDYERADVFHRFYPVDALPSEQRFESELKHMIQVYENRLSENIVTSARTEVINGPDVLVEFGRLISNTGVRFSNAFIRTFLASALTKRFVILTGLSGSGKTQIAKQFGKYLGPGRMALIPVRPDWTGSEALFGYENVLAEPDEHGRPWIVPDALRFMLRAANDSNHPYLLILDEMNLAHVERYFADVLSGMESAEPCLPNLVEENGKWVPAGTITRIPFPENLIVMGTVNVDETTYMFSPKVLDRANTIEFRVSTSDLPEDISDLKSIGDCTPGSTENLRELLRLASDSDSHQVLHPAWLNDFAKRLRDLHGLLAPHGFEFGHRVYAEAVRFACIHAALGDDNLEHALDLQLLQKVLPRIHGARRRVEPVLKSLGAFAFHGKEHSDSVAFDPVDSSHQGPVLVQSFDKIRRMTERVRANQFVSFAE